MYSERFHGFVSKILPKKFLPTKMLTCTEILPKKNFTHKNFTYQNFTCKSLVNPHVKIVWLSTHITTYKQG